MLSITKKLAIAIIVFSSTQFYAHGTDYNNGVVKVEESAKCCAVAARSNDHEASQLVTADSASAGILQAEFFPLVTVIDMKKHLAGHMLEVDRSPCLLAQVCKSWHQFILDRPFVKRAKEDIATIPFLASSPLAQQYMLRWWKQRDMQILKAGIFRYQPEGSATIDVKLSTMYEANGDLALPAELAQVLLCVTWETETFVRPVSDNTRKILVLLLTLSELKRVAQQISMDASFIQNVDQADLSQNAVCALIRYDGDGLGFRYTILKYREMSGLSFRLIYTHKKSCGDRAGVRGWLRYLGCLIF